MGSDATRPEKALGLIEGVNCECRESEQWWRELDRRARKRLAGAHSQTERLSARGMSLASEAVPSQFLGSTTAAAMDAYAAFHAHALHGDTAQAHASLVFVPNQYGLGNRLRAMKASLLIAMLTGRVFHVRWDDPFPVSSLLRPEGIDWREPQPPLPRTGATAIHRCQTGVCQGCDMYSSTEMPQTTSLC